MITERAVFLTRVDPQLHAQVKTIATEHGISMNQFVENAVRRELAALAHAEYDNNPDLRATLADAADSPTIHRPRT